MAKPFMRDYSRKLRGVIQYKIKEENMYNLNIDEKGFKLGTANCASHGTDWKAPTQDGTCKPITVVEVSIGVFNPTPKQLPIP